MRDYDSMVNRELKHTKNLFLAAQASRDDPVLVDGGPAHLRRVIHGEGGQVSGVYCLELHEYGNPLKWIEGTVRHLALDCDCDMST